MLNAQNVTTEEELDTLLSRMGFFTKPVRFSLRQRLHLTPDESHRPLCRYIEAERNGLEGPVVVAVRSSTLEVYFYEDVNYAFHIWERLGESTSDEQLRKAIFEASSTEAINRRYPTLR